MGTSSKRKFIQFMTSGKLKQLVNDNESDTANYDFVHPLEYSPDYKNYPNITIIPMNYKFQRKFYEQYLMHKKLK